MKVLIYHELAEESPLKMRSWHRGGMELECRGGMIDKKDRQLTHMDHRAGGRRLPLILLLDDISDPANVGAVFRIADALGVERLLLCGKTAVPPNRRLTRTSRMTDKVIAYQYCETPEVVALRLQGYHLIALELTQHSVDLKTVDFGLRGKICLILGAEHAGVNSELLEIVDQTVHIPMLGQNSSMNVATACAIAVYEITRNL